MNKSVHCTKLFSIKPYILPEVQAPKIITDKIGPTQQPEYMDRLNGGYGGYLGMDSFLIQSIGKCRNTI